MAKQPIRSSGASGSGSSGAGGRSDRAQNVRQAAETALLMPDYWQFPTVWMGLGPLMAIYQARFLKYLHFRGLANTADRKVWAFLGDGEMDEPESTGAISLAAREKLDNLVFVINCNLQRTLPPRRTRSRRFSACRSSMSTGPRPCCSSSAAWARAMRASKNELFFRDNTMMLFGDAKKVVDDVLKAL